MNELPPIAQRDIRVQTAVSLHEPDRVPFIPTINNFLSLEYGVSIQDSMPDPMSIVAPLDRFLDRYEPDLVNLPPCFSIQAMNRSQFSAGRWPGLNGLPENTPYQYVDHQYLEDEEYDAFLADPTRFVLTRILPEKHRAYAGLAMLEPFTLCNQAIFSQAPFGLPPVRAALEAMMETGAEVLKTLGGLEKLALHTVERGFIPFGGATGQAPFDEFADYVRGLLETCMDCVNEPERLAQALRLWGERTIPASIESAKLQNTKYLFIPLHCGVDNFMSVANYEKFYWPGLKKLIEAAVAADMTPFVLCEGKYYTRLPILADVPKGKVIYVFEDTDFVEAKRVLGDVACIAGGLPTEYLMLGDKQRVIDETKRLIDLLAPGGGYIMSNSLALDQVKTENMEAWRDTVFSYGQY